MLLLAFAFYNPLAFFSIVISQARREDEKQKVLANI